MSNMSYCRFQNTEKDLDACKDALSELMWEREGPLSDEELRAAKSLVKLCAEILMDVAEASSIDSDEILDLALDTEKLDKALDQHNREAQEQERGEEQEPEERCGEALPEHGGPQ